MPQMSPLNWLILFILFSLIFIFINIYNYYNIELNPSLIKNNNDSMKNSYNWKW